MTIFVGNLSFDAEVEDLQNLFTQYGEVRKCSLPLMTSKMWSGWDAASASTRPNPAPPLAAAVEEVAGNSSV
jgi:RNA recognition motif-containing protein